MRLCCERIQRQVLRSRNRHRTIPDTRSTLSYEQWVSSTHTLLSPGRAYLVLLIPGLTLNLVLLLPGLKVSLTKGVLCKRVRHYPGPPDMLHPSPWCQADSFSRYKEIWHSSTPFLLENLSSFTILSQAPRSH